MSVAAEAIHAPLPTNDATLAANKQAKVLFDLVQKKPLPIFKQTLQRLGRFHNKPSSSIPKIVKTLRLDPCYSHEIFLKANAGLIKNNRQPVSSLDHAILVLGIPQVIAIGKQLPLISDLKNSPEKFRIIQVISRAHHAGIQASELMSDHELGRTSTETAFITAQLRNLFLVGLWLYAPEEISKLLKTSQSSSLLGKGGVLSEVGKMLSQQWHYSDLLQQSLEPKSDSSRLVKTIAFANQLAQLSENGWYSEQMDHLIAQSAKTLGIFEDDLSQSSHRNAVIAARESTFYPIKPAAYRLIETNRSEVPVVKTPPISRKKVFTVHEDNLRARKTEQISKTVQRKKAAVKTKESTVDLNSQLQVLSEMSRKNCSPQEILSFCFNLLTNITEKNPVAFFLLDRSKTSLKSRFTENFIDPKKVTTLPIMQKNIFRSLMQKQQSVWINDKNRKKYSQLLPAEFPIKIRDTDFAAMSLFIQSKPIGLFYLESNPKKQLSSDHYQQFVSICKTTIKSLEEVKKHAK